MLRINPGRINVKDNGRYISYDTITDDAILQQILNNYADEKDNIDFNDETMDWGGNE